MSQKTILIVDPDIASRRFFETMLTKKDYKVLACSGGKEGLIMAWREHPDVILFESALTDLPALEFLKKIRQDRRTESVPVIAVVAQPRPDQMATFLSSGCNEYIAKDAQTITVLSELLPRLLANVVSDASEVVTSTQPVSLGGYLVVFLSAKGGTGTSSLCANVADTVAQLNPGASVVVVDLVLPLGSLDSITGSRNTLTIVDVAERNINEITPEFFKKHLPQPDKWHFRVLTGAPNPEKANSLQVGRLPEVLKVLRQTYDYVFVDLGRSLSRISLPIITAADVATIIVGTEVSAVSLTRSAWDYLQLQGVDAQRVYMILNRAVGLEGLPKSEAEKVIGLRIQAGIPYMSDNFVMANNQHVPVLSKFPNNTAALMMKQISQEISELARKMRPA
jgi:MinD-like ATPase involved in chromosome partitioning or flagellar assembly/CheY-like chemotaxis protein